MIIDLNLQNKVVVVIGGGREAEKRISALVGQKCKIIVLAKETTKLVNDLARIRKIQLKKIKIRDSAFITKYKPDIVITTTDDSKINQQIIAAAKKKKILAYSSDNPESSDFSNPAIINFENAVQIAIFTGGKSPAMSKKIKSKVQKALKKIITKEEIGQIKIQKIVRENAKKTIATQNERRRALLKIMADKTIKQLINDGNLKRAEKRAMSMLRDENGQ
ncbi:MAG: bifunctional precorrin-2 dehydrogenase/sirohydrochlorin ferrochelatase [Nitrosopumilaceae archaeon]|nr:bifunctional precorrin-2 dehydrogenase/sirohydrochlorin ferrochelatase [Nitrosopumilaceae archaeon]